MPISRAVFIDKRLALLHRIEQGAQAHLMEKRKAVFPVFEPGCGLVCVGGLSKGSRRISRERLGDERTDHGKRKGMKWKL